MKRMYKYHAYGLKISSDIELEELTLCEFNEKQDLLIELGPVPDQICGEIWSDTWWQKDENHLLFNYTDVVKALISNQGDKVVLQKLTNDSFEFRSFIYSRILSACLLIKGYFYSTELVLELMEKLTRFVVLRELENPPWRMVF